MDAVIQVSGSRHWLSSVTKLRAFYGTWFQVNRIVSHGAVVGSHRREHLRLSTWGAGGKWHTVARSLAAQRMQPRLTTTKLCNSCINDAFRLDHNCAGANHVAWWVDGRGKIQLANRHAGAA
ncbi:hypothetical protein CIHG_06891 [Coccidioides immitis H538.4]|uniref:Uncharacterized protein n=3 Tax=Coccidioides immitis TaxID=5501 RepID=A0A0J8TUM5_COCIT|nr:hypothetical protein CIRG_04444 [Coccidioides immitis RMSCC 2394]KMU77527.1 hypothetical protein CISG_06529 [Coccidioides immitis RMSCC 3703]KMU89089.1 hypothetical protein CIHG_06891 [Coccidioides immitis H538.4]